MTTQYEFDESAASKADDVAGRVDQSGTYIGTFKMARPMKSSKGTEGVAFEFVSPGGGSADFTLWTRKEDGSAVFGMNQLQAIMAVLNVRGLKASKGKFTAFDADSGTRLEQEGEVFSELIGKSIGVVLQKELYTKNNGAEGFRMNLYGIFHAESKLTASEIKERKTTPEKLEKMLRSLKTKDSRRAVAPEPVQPALTAEGSF
jgi:hypothetical protein